MSKVCPENNGGGHRPYIPHAEDRSHLRFTGETRVSANGLKVEGQYAKETFMRGDLYCSLCGHLLENNHEFNHKVLGYVWKQQ